MSESNQRAKKQLIELYGAECFIDKLHLRKDKEPRHYTGQGQLKKMKQLTYHHILEKRNGGRATVENGALLSFENHQWFNRQPPKAQAQMNRKFQEYKQSIDCGIEYVDDLDLDFTVECQTFSLQKDGIKVNKGHVKGKHNKHKSKKKHRQENQRLKKEFEDR